MDRRFSHYDLNVKNTFPARGRAWCKWEEDFLLDWLEAFGLNECARQLGRTPASVALRCAWLGIRKPVKVSADASSTKQEPNLELCTSKEAPRSPSETSAASAGVGAGVDAGTAPEGKPEALEANNGEAGNTGAIGMAECSATEPARAPLPNAPKKLSKAGVPWSPEEDEKLQRFASMGWTYARCAAELPGRTNAACSNRMNFLRRKHSKAEAESKAGGREKAVRNRLEVFSGRMRKCHDCGKPTANYRCPQCWEKIRGRIALEEEGL